VSKSFRSDKWIPEIKTLCLNFLAKIKEYPGGHYLCFRDDLGIEMIMTGFLVWIMYLKTDLLNT
jgi:hypothetical protein